LKTYDNIWQERYDLQATVGREEYQKLFHHSFQQQLSHRKIVLDILAKASLRHDARLLDVGCGTGAYLREMKRQRLGKESWGIDISCNLLKKALQLDPTLSGYLIQGGVDFLPVRDGLFDAVLAIGVLQTVENHQSALRELCRATKPGGILIISTLRKHVIWELIFLPLLLFMSHFGNNQVANETLEMVRNRGRLIWKRLPRGFPPKRYDFREIKEILSENEMEGVHCFFPGRLRRLPRLLNSFHMFILARKPCLKTI
jgi:ubiquinone/menaquinone biosynthesis C-methylase UbiE